MALVRRKSNRLTRSRDAYPPARPDLAGGTPAVPTRAGRLSQLIQFIQNINDYDVLPDFSQQVRQVLRHPLGWLLIAAAVAGLCALVVHPRVWALSGGLIAVAAAGVGWPWVTLRGVQGQIRFEQERVREGESTGVQVTLVNPWPWPAWGVDLVPVGLNPEERPSEPGVRSDSSAEASQAERLHFPTLPGRARGRYHLRVTPRQRGLYPGDPWVLRCGVPFGVWEAKRVVASERPLIVWPRVGPVGPLPSIGGADAEGGVPQRRLVGGLGEVVGVRPYRRGDSPRRIHWPQSAKHDRLVVCEVQPVSRPAIQLVLDTSQADHTPGMDGTWEWSIRVAASLAQGWLEAGAAVGLADHEQDIPANAGRDQIRRILDRLAELRPGSVPLARRMAAPGWNRLRDVVRVLITTDAAASQFTPGRRGGSPSEDRWVILRQSGFGGPVHTSGGPSPTLGSTGASTLGPTPWLTLMEPDSVFHQLRHDTPEARHGG